MTRQVDLLIIGAGCAGWFVSLMLALRGIVCTILDMNPPGAFASTSNQGWLHSGVGHTVVARDPRTVSACRDGSHWIRSHYPDVVYPDIPCYFLMHEEEDLQRCLTLCQQEDLLARPVSLDKVKEREPILKKSPLRYAMQTSDMPINTSRLLQAVIDEACHRGVRFQAVENLETISALWDGRMWQVFLDQEHEIQARSVVLTCGAYIPEMMQRFMPSVAPGFKRTKNPVLVLHREVARSMLITVYAPHGPNLVPFYGEEGIGANICLSWTDKESLVAQDRTLSKDVVDVYQESFGDFYSGLITMIEERGAIPAHIYACQKLHLNDNLAANPLGRVAIHLSYAPQAGMQKSLFVFYPGKLTAAPIAAQACAEDVERCLGDQRIGHSPLEISTPIPTIARRRYYNVPEYILAVRDSKLAFRPIK
jgi:FAD dependent oxidoreductase